MNVKRHTSPAPVPRRRHVIAAAAVATVLLGLTACSAQPAAGQLGAQLLNSSGTLTGKAATSSSDYSLTQTVQNNSNVPLTLQGVPTVDNNAVLQPGYPTVIAPKTSGTYKATNEGNGVQMWIHFSTPNGATIVVDSDVPKVNGNGFDHKIAGAGIGFDDKNTSIGGGDNPRAQVTLVSCTSDCTTKTNGSGIVS
jgi:hypothetical protein